MICEWIFIWFAFIEHGDTSDDVLSSLYYVPGPAPFISTFLSSIKVSVADGIMVYTHLNIQAAANLCLLAC
jgi:hypothetical protein